MPERRVALHEGKTMTERTYRSDRTAVPFADFRAGSGEAQPRPDRLCANRLAITAA